MEIKHLTAVSILVGSLLTISNASAVITGYVNNSTTNSTDWSAAVVGFSGIVNNNINFETHSVGALDPNYYLVSDGVTLTPAGDVNTVANGAGPGQANITGSSLGEGPHPVSNYLQDGGSPSTLTISFNSAVFGAGLFVIDYFNPSGANPLTIEAFDGPNGTGSSLGSFSSVAENFQPNNMYFMGIADSNGLIRSVVFNDVNSATGDTTGIDDILFAPSNGIVNYTVGGSISGLGGDLTLQNNGGDDLLRNTNGNFTFPAPLTDTADYNVTVSIQPAFQTCIITNGSGTIATANVTDIVVTCEQNPVEPVPTMSVWGLGILASILGFIGFKRRMK